MVKEDCGELSAINRSLKKVKSLFKSWYDYQHDYKTNPSTLQSLGYECRESLTLFLGTIPSSTRLIYRSKMFLCCFLCSVPCSCPVSSVRWHVHRLKTVYNFLLPFLFLSVRYARPHTYLRREIIVKAFISPLEDTSAHKHQVTNQTTNEDGGICTKQKCAFLTLANCKQRDLSSGLERIYLDFKDFVKWCNSTDTKSLAAWNNNETKNLLKHLCSLLCKHANRMPML